MLNNLFIAFKIFLAYEENFIYISDDKPIIIIINGDFNGIIR